MKILKKLTTTALLTFISPILALAQPAVTSIIAPAPVIQGITGKVGIYTQATQPIELYTSIDGTRKGFSINGSTGALTSVGGAGLGVMTLASPTFTGALTSDATSGGNIVFGKNATGIIKSSNADALYLSGGSSINSSAAGANLVLFGSSSGGAQGTAYLYGGAQATGNILLQILHASAQTRFLNSSSGTMWHLNNSGDFTQDATNGGNIVMPKNFAGVHVMQGLTTIPGDISAQWSSKFYGFQNATVPSIINAYGAANASGSNLLLIKSRDTTGQANVVVASGDTLGNIMFSGADGADFRSGATIRAIVDGAPGIDDMPGRLEFLTTTDGTNVGSIALTIENDQDLLATQRFTSSRATDLGWTRVNVANQACNTTCTSACVMGIDTLGTNGFLLCTDATADSCLCAGAS